MPKFADTRLGKAWAALTAAQLDTEVKGEGDVPPTFGNTVMQPPTAQAPAAPAPPAPAQPAAQAPAATSGPKEIGAEVRALIEETADAYCEVLTVKSLALPNQLAQIKNDFIRAAIDDRAMPVAQGETTRLVALKQRIEGVEAHKLATERVPDKDAPAARVVTAQQLSQEDAQGAKVEEQERAIAKRNADRVTAQAAAR